MWLLLVLLLRVFHPIALDTLDTARHTHIAVTGTVTIVRKEADGDIHIKLIDGKGHFIVCEIIPELPLPAPRVGTIITVQGIYRFDKEVGHGWHEVHPVIKWFATP